MAHDQINGDTIGELRFAWDYHTGTTRGLEATPIVVDGVLFTSGTTSRAYALDAASGEEIWRFFTVPGDPANSYEHPELEKIAAPTWDPSEAFDPQTGETLWEQEGAQYIAVMAVQRAAAGGGNAN
jgi:outer membrane protein assembly factor BamB